MKHLCRFALMLALVSVPAFAAKNSQTINFPDPVKVGATQLPAGDYNVTWTGTGPAVQLTLAQQHASHPASATVSAKLVDQKNGRAGFIVNREDNANVLQSIELNKFDLVITSNPVSGQ